MKISYQVLWIEDHLEMVEPQIQGIEDKLKDYGFKFKVDGRESLSEEELQELIKKLERYNPYDMIILDYDLGQQMQTGDNIAFNLRTNLYTDMIFYSGKSPENLRTALFDKGVEGVFTVDRANFVDEVWPIIEDQIKRIFDINNMRGVLLDEMSRIDLKLRELYQREFASLDEERRDLQVNRLRKRIKNRHKSIDKLIEQITIETIADIVLDPLRIDFETVLTRLNSLFKTEGFFGPESDLVAKQKLRNKFAHNKSEYNKEKGTVYLNGFDEEYSFEDFKNIRLELLNILDKLENQYDV